MAKNGLTDTAWPHAERRVLVTGAAGMLGSELCLRAPDGIIAVGTDLRAAMSTDVANRLRRTSINHKVHPS